jgi:hypothetical protein
VKAKTSEHSRIRGVRIIDMNTWDRCYDFKSISAKKVAKNWHFLFKMLLGFAKIWIVTSDFKKNVKRHFFAEKCQKSPKIDHNIDPWCRSFSSLLRRRRFSAEIRDKFSIKRFRGNFFSRFRKIDFRAQFFNSCSAQLVIFNPSG